MKTTLKLSLACLFIALGLLVPLFFGCTEQPSRQHSSYQLPENKFYKVEVISDPPGARVEVNNDFVCDAPCTISLEGWQGRRESAKRLEIRAIPNAAGEYQQVKFIQPGEPIPHKMLFAMNLGPAVPEVNVNVNGQ